MKELLAELLDDAFNLDNRLFRTLKALATQPGKITLTYLEGKRMMYIPPFRLYLLLSILLVFSDTSSDSDVFQNYVSRSENNGKKMRSIQFLFRNVEMDSLSFSKVNTLTDREINSVIEKNGTFSDPVFRSYIRKIQSLDSEKGRAKLASEEGNLNSTSLIFSMPFLALILFGLFRRRPNLYFKHLIHAIHLNSIGFILYIIGEKIRNQVVYIFLLGQILEINAWKIQALLFLIVFSVFIPLFFYSLISLKRVYTESWLATIPKFLIVFFLYSTFFNFLILLLRIGVVFYLA